MRVGSMRDDAVLGIDRLRRWRTTNDKERRRSVHRVVEAGGHGIRRRRATAEDIAMLDAFGMSVGLDVNEDGTCALIMFGEPLDGTWEAKSATEATFTIDAAPSPRPSTDGKLKMDEDATP